jgi:hypothetical protein
MKRELLLIAVLTAAGCRGTDDGPAGTGTADGNTAGEATVVAEAPAKPAQDATADAAASPGKPTAPIAIDYQIIGTPIVGNPVSIDVNVSSTRGDVPIKLSYRIVDADSLSFAEAQPQEVALGRVSERQPAVRQVTVIPQREGRLYLNVTAEIETPDGALIKSMAIPIQVGSGPGKREKNGEVTVDADGEAIISLPADEG